MSFQTWMETIYVATADGTAVAASTTETILMPANSMLMPANYMQEPRALEWWAFGQYGTTATPTLQFALRWGGVGGTVIAKSAANTLTSGVGSGATMTAQWSAHGFIICRTHGSAGTFFSPGDGIMDTSTAFTAGTVTQYGEPFPIASGSTGGTTPATATVDTTVATDLTMTALWGTNNAANSIKTNTFILKSLN